MKKTLLIGLWLTACAWAQELGIPKVYKGDEGLQVTVLRYGPRESNQALVMFSGVDSPWNNMVFLTKHEETDRASDYYVQKNGEPRYLIVGRKHWGSYWNYEAFPGDRKEYKIYYDETLSKQTRAEDVLQKYQTSPGTP